LCERHGRLLRSYDGHHLTKNLRVRNEKNLRLKEHDDVILPVR
jgi:hypothetical protein